MGDLNSYLSNIPGYNQTIAQIKTDQAAKNAPITPSIIDVARGKKTVPTKDEAIEKAATQNIKATSLFPGAPQATADSNALTKSLTPSQGSVSEPSASALGLNPSNIQVTPSPTAAGIPVPASKATPVANAPTKIPPVAGQPASVSAPQGAPDSMAVGGQDYRAEGTPPSAQDMQAITQEIEKNPSVGEQILQLAKNTGTSVLELIQGMAKGFSGSDIPLASQVREAEKMKGMEIEAQKQRQIADQQFQQTLAQLQDTWTQKRFEQGKEFETSQEAKRLQQAAQQAGLERENARTIAGMGRTYQKGVGYQEKLKGDVLPRGGAPQQ